MDLAEKITLGTFLCARFQEVLEAFINHEMVLEGGVAAPFIAKSSSFESITGQGT